MDQLEMNGISKSFSGTKVLENVSLTVRSGQVIALLGENGAGKSTLMKILTGVYRADSGSFTINGQPLSIGSITDARQQGIEIIHQELNLFTNLSIRENFLIGYEKEYQHFGLIDYKKLNEDVRSVLELVQLDRKPTDFIASLGIGERQLIEIAKALKWNAKFLVMDEPTAALTETETKILFENIKRLKSNGVGIVYISHRMEELFEISDRVVVLRDGHVVIDKETKDAVEKELISAMVGRNVEDRYPKSEVASGQVILKLENISTEFVAEVSMDVCSGEVVGIGGLMGAGRTELARAIAGVDKVIAGQMYFSGNVFRPKTPQDAISLGIAYITEDRKSQGLIMPFTVRENLMLPTLKRRSRFGFIQFDKEKKQAQELVQKLRIRTTSIEAAAESLSGGNQQKIVIAKWLASEPKLLVLDEPTRGIDVGAKQEIYHLINEMKERGMGVLMISSDLPELLGMSDRVFIMHEGKIQGRLDRRPFKQEEFMALATGGEIN